MATLPPFKRTVDMVEDGRVVVRHVFYGRDAAEAAHMEQAHRGADASLDASMRGKPYKGTDIKAVRSKGEVPMHPLHKKIADLAGIDADAFHKGKIVPKREARASEVGWTDEARAAAILSRRARAGEKQKTLYHVTGSDRVSKILKQGIVPGHTSAAYGSTSQSSGGRVFLTDLPGAKGLADEIGGNTVILKVSVPGEHLGRGEYPGDAMSIEPKEWSVKGSIHPSRVSVQAPKDRHDDESMSEAEGDGSNQYQKKGGAVPTKDEVVKRFGAELAKHGARVDGVWDLRDVGQEPHLAYTDNVTGSSLMTPMSKATLRHLLQRLQDKRKEFAGARESQATLYPHVVRAEVVPGANPAKAVRLQEMARAHVRSVGMGPHSDARIRHGSGDKAHARDRVVRAVLCEGGPGSGIVSHINPALTAEARSAYEGDGSNQYKKKGGRSKFAPAEHEPDEGVRVEMPAVRAERIRAMKVDPARAQIIKRAIGMRASLVA